MRGYLLGKDNQSTAQTAKQLVAPRTNGTFFVTRLIVSNGATAGTLKLVSDTGGSPTDMIPVVYLPINGLVELDFSDAPLAVPAGKDVGYTSATVTTHSVMLFGYSTLAVTKARI